jgi:hypothetical protein
MVPDYIGCVNAITYYGRVSCLESNRVSHRLVLLA